MKTVFDLTNTSNFLCLSFMISTDNNLVVNATEWVNVFLYIFIVYSDSDIIQVCNSVENNHQIFLPL